jgi:hypothetical protein
MPNCCEQSAFADCQPTNSRDQRWDEPFLVDTRSEYQPALAGDRHRAAHAWQLAQHPACALLEGWIGKAPLHRAYRGGHQIPCTSQEDVARLMFEQSGFRKPEPVVVYECPRPTERVPLGWCDLLDGAQQCEIHLSHARHVPRALTTSASRHASF